MNSSENEESPSTPLLTDTDFRRRILQLLGFASERSLSVLLIDGDGIQLPIIVTLDELPASPDSETLKLLVGDLGERLALCGADGSLAFVLERPGQSQPHAFDELWAGAVFAAGEAAGVRIIGVYLLHSKGVRMLRARVLPSF
ncbi:MAG: hypothetical protein H7226_11150 [Salinibacterium sp.]|nr:hypothetical protein [Salinibacterium sp.]